jgi:SAM-dependent methyltransferase
MLDDFKHAQRKGWAHFAPLAASTTIPAARLVRHAGIASGDQVLDVACGTGVVAVTAAMHGAQVTALDLTPELLAVARDNARVAGVEIEFHEGDVEALPFPDGRFDRVTSQFGHIFAPRADVALAEMLRVLRPGGTIAFSTWPPELYVGRIFALSSRYMPPPPPGISSPLDWGDPTIIRSRLGSAVRDIVFDRDTMLVPALSVQHSREIVERTAGPVMKLVELLSGSDPARLDSFRAEFDALTSEYLRNNTVHQGFLLTRAVKV